MDFNYFIKDNNLSFCYSNGRSIMSGDEFHDFYELLYIFKASGYLLLEKEKARLASDMLILIPKETYHNFTFTENSEYVRCRIWFSELPEFRDAVKKCTGEIRIISHAFESFGGLFTELAKISCVECPDVEKKLLLHSAILRIIFELTKENAFFEYQHMQPQSKLIQDAVEIINEHLSEKISIEEIASRLFVSPSQLSHEFKKELNISVYKFITLKRLFNVQKLIKSGAKVSFAARCCGFCDYSSFYRIYKKYYGTSPCKLI